MVHIPENFALTLTELESEANTSPIPPPWRIPWSSTVIIHMNSVLQRDSLGTHATVTEEKTEGQNMSALQTKGRKTFPARSLVYSTRTHAKTSVIRDNVSTLPSKFSKLEYQFRI